MRTNTQIDYVEYDFTVEGSIHEITRFRNWIDQEWRSRHDPEGFYAHRSRHRGFLTVRFYMHPSARNPMPEIVCAFSQLIFHGSATESAFRRFAGRKGHYPDHA
jgi:hypothetical protein